MASGAPSMSVPLASADFEVFRDRTTFPNLPHASLPRREPPVAELGSEKGPLLRFDSPSECYRGALPERLSPSVSPACASARVRLSWGSSSLRRLTQGAPFLPRSARPTAGDEGYRTLARFRPRASSTRPSSPCGALDRASVAPRRFEPRRLLQARVSPLPQFRRRYAPELSQPVTRPRHVPGIRPSELSLPEEPCRLSTAFCFLAGSTSTVSPARRFLAVRPVSTARLVLASLAAPREEDTRSRRWTRERGFPAIVKTACPLRELPRTATSTTDTGDLRARRHAAVSPASKPCSPRESVHATDREFPRACARRSPRPTGPVLSWVLPLQSFLHHDLGFGRLRRSPGGEAEQSRKSQPRSGRQNRGFDPEA